MTLFSMKQLSTSFLQFGAILLINFALSITYAYAQCTYSQAMHTSGTQQVGCSTVTVTSSGEVGVGSSVFCSYGPYKLGGNSSGSYTFSFSPPVSGFKVNLEPLDNHNGKVEELVVYINGSFYPLTNAGTPDGCWDPVIVWPPGTIRADPAFFWGSGQDIEVSANISTLTLENNIVSGQPAGFVVSLYVCCETCTTSAGQIASGPLKPCIDKAAIAPPATQTNLDGDDILQYILFSDPTDPMGSVLATNSDPNFNFDPSTMNLGNDYFIAAIAGDGLNGSIDPNDPCVSISNQVAVTWQSKPTAMLYAIDECLSPNNCYNIGVTLTGNPPFQLEGEVESEGNVITTFSGTFGNYNSIINICLPTYTPTGPIDINVTSLADTSCDCN